ncbi:MAG: NAD-dependent epimerase/dehydratase family protein [Methanobrevibacter sp.]|nr:NAD-dependent epimerase/dehydratase family protein [Methanobrevibacter sp.]
MKNKNVVVTGGLGFVGSQIVDELLDDNKVTIIDNESAGKIENLKDPKHENLDIIIDDLNNVDLDKVLNGKDYVFHLAAMASVPLSVDDPISCNKNNIDTTVKLLTAMKNTGVKKIIFSSSAAVYGENTNMPLKETEPYMPTSPYAASKACGELYIESFIKSYKINGVILRYFNVFGPKQDKNSQYASVIPNFISAILEGEKPVIYGDGEQTRDFVFVKDVVNANIKAAESDYNGIVNVASGKKISINKLYEIIKNTLETDIEPEYLPERKGDIKHSLANVNNMKNINYKINSDDFENQLKETINWFKTQL